MRTDYKMIIVLIGAMFLTQKTFAETQSLATVEQVAYAYALTQAQLRFDSPQVIVEPLDNRLRLNNCDKELQAFVNNTITSPGSHTIGVKCDAPVAWTVYVPARIKVFQPVVVTAKPLSANRVVTDADVKVENMDISSLHRGFFSRKSEVVGKQLKHPLTLGRVVFANTLKTEKVVKRGEQVVLLAGIGQMEVRMGGTALSDAALGERIRAINSSSQRVIEGVVDAPGVIRVTM